LTRTGDAWLSGTHDETYRLHAGITPMAVQGPEAPSPSLDLAPGREVVLTFSDLLRKAGIDPAEVRLLRHQDASADPGRSPFALWRTDPPAFIEYQARQSPRAEKLLSSAKFWASFVVTRGGETLFADLYAASFLGVGAVDCPMVHRAGEVDRAGAYIRFALAPVNALAALSGRIVIDWGRGYLAWIQRAGQQEKPILELRRAYEEEQFPGFGDLILSLSAVPTLPPSWVAVLRASRGIYLLTCPRTKEQYVGSATGEEGFWGRWREYYETGHGGNVRLKSREPSDYRIAVLEVAGSEQTTVDILRIEQRWMRKLQSSEMGLNS
jgi:hypothetical protein